MTLQLKALSKEAIPRALEKAERYRLLNEPVEAESICLDVLAIEADNQQALVTLLLALTDQFNTHLVGPETSAALARLHSEYDRAYYTGIVNERHAKACLHQGTPGCEATAYDLLRQAMTWYEKAEAIRSQENDDAVLRWNTCARILMRNPRLVPRLEEAVDLPLE